MASKQQGIERTEHGEEQPTDRKRAQQAPKSNPEQDTGHPVIEQKPGNPRDAGK